jgi:hypothetical protein
LEPKKPRGRKPGKSIYKPPSRKHGLTAYQKAITVNDLRRELVSALYVDAETLKVAFRDMLANRPYDAFRVLTSLMPKEVTVSDANPELPPLVQSIRAAMADAKKAVIEVVNEKESV